MALTALGVVYGDIGTSPLYAHPECFGGPHGVAAHPGQRLRRPLAGLLVAQFRHLVQVRRASSCGRTTGARAGSWPCSPCCGRGSGHAGRPLGCSSMAGLFGAALLYGDGIITPAISVLGAIEGLEVAAPGLNSLGRAVDRPGDHPGPVLCPEPGHGGVGGVFGPVTTRLVLLHRRARHRTASRSTPRCWQAVNPWHAWWTSSCDDGVRGFLVLGRWCWW